MNSTRQDDATTIAMCAMLAYAASVMTHEALGHGGYCLAAGGHTAILTAWWETCRFPGSTRLAIKAAGPAAQFVAGLLVWLSLRLWSGSTSPLRVSLWFYMVFDLFLSSGYIAFSGVTGLGDAAELIAGLPHHSEWRWGLIIAGTAVFYLSMHTAARELHRWAGSGTNTGRLYRLVGIAYFATGVFACCTAALTQRFAVGGLAVAAPGMYKAMGHGAALSLAVASSFGAGAGLFALPHMAVGKSPATPATANYLRWDAAFLAVASIVLICFLIFIGPGLR